MRAHHRYSPRLEAADEDEEDEGAEVVALKFRCLLVRSEGRKIEDYKKFDPVFFFGVGFSGTYLHGFGAACASFPASGRDSGAAPCASQVARTRF